MGADFMFYCCESPRDIAKAMPLILERIASLDNETLDDISERLMFWDAQLVEDEYRESCPLKEEDLWKLDDLISIKVRDMVRCNIREAVKELWPVGSFGSFRRDVVELELGNVTYMMTGGMSWGDAPTEACDVVNLIEASGVTEGMGRVDLTESV